MGKIKKETWKDIEGYEGIYQISDFGRVKSLERIVSYEINGRRRSRLQKESIRKQKINRWGYKSVNLNKDASIKTFEIHRLVATHFLNCNYDGKQVNHIDGDKENNVINNLEFVTPRDNIKHAFENGLIPIRVGRKLNQEKADKIRREKNSNPNISHADLSMRYGVSVRTIIDVLNNVSWKNLR